MQVYAARRGAVFKHAQIKHRADKVLAVASHSSIPRAKGPGTRHIQRLPYEDAKRGSALDVGCMPWHASEQHYKLPSKPLKPQTTSAVIINIIISLYIRL